MMQFVYKWIWNHMNGCFLGDEMSWPVMYMTTPSITKNVNKRVKQTMLYSKHGAI